MRSGACFVRRPLVGGASGWPLLRAGAGVTGCGIGLWCMVAQVRMARGGRARASGPSMAVAQSVPGLLCAVADTGVSHLGKPVHGSRFRPRSQGMTVVGQGMTGRAFLSARMVPSSCSILQAMGGVRMELLG